MIDGASIGHVMISYQWKNKDMLIRVRDHLRQRGYTVWMDVDNMCRSLSVCNKKVTKDARFKNEYLCIPLSRKVFQRWVCSFMMRLYFFVYNGN